MMIRIVVKPFVCFLIVVFLSTINVFAKNNLNYFPIEGLAAPIVSTPLYLCQNSVAVPLNASPSVVGATLKWYSAASGGVQLTDAPTPITTTVGTTTYYVTETVGSIESSPRTPIVVNVVADTGAIAATFRCDPTQVTTATSVFFDWSHVVGRAGNFYNYSYSIQGGPTVFGNTPLSGQEVFGLLPGQSVSFTILTVLGLPCYPTQTLICGLDCVTKGTPLFGTTPTSYCLNDVVVLPTTSDDGILGFWAPLSVDTSTMGTNDYVFTPDPLLFPCALKTTLSISVEPIEPSFTDYSLCAGDVPPTLDPVSPNGIVGFWNPATIDTMNSAAYVFTPDPGQPCTPAIKTINVAVNPSNTIVDLKWTVSDAFSKKNSVTVTDPVGSNYLYQMDSGPVQTAALFENVASGLHSITVKDSNGCSELTNNNVVVVGYPKYFTPNGDGYNDFWTISSLDNSSNSRIYIFDRYGKLLKDLSLGSKGWDGTYIGRPMPADDYWFTVEYEEESVMKQFKSHFSLKR